MTMTLKVELAMVVAVAMAVAVAGAVVWRGNIYTLGPKPDPDIRGNYEMHLILLHTFCAVLCGFSCSSSSALWVFGKSIKIPLTII